MGAPTLGESERVRRIQNKNAPKYDRQMNFFDPVLFAGGREWACAQAQGDVLEIAVGSGRNLPYYPQGVKLTAIEFSPEMLAIARERAAQLGREVDLREAEALDFADDSFDITTRSSRPTAPGCSPSASSTSTGPRPVRPVPSARPPAYPAKQEGTADGLLRAETNRRARISFRSVAGLRPRPTSLRKQPS